MAHDEQGSSAKSLSRDEIALRGRGMGVRGRIGGGGGAETGIPGENPRRAPENANTKQIQKIQAPTEPRSCATALATDVFLGQPTC